MWQRQIVRLLTTGHLIGLCLTIGPGLGWAWLLIDGGYISRDELLTVWAHQAGIGKFLDLAPSPTDEPAFLINHYATFPLHLVVMCFPAVVWVGFAVRPRHGLPDDIRRFLTCAAAGPALVLWLYPESRPRHVMPILFPVAVLGAMTVVGRFRAGDGWTYCFRQSGIVWSLIPTVVGGLGVCFAALKHPGQVVPASVGLGVGVIWTHCSLRHTWPTANRPIAVAVPLAGAMLAAWGAANAVLFPGLADRAPTRVALEPLVGQIGRDEVVYTTRRFPVRGDGYYNLQFHLARDVRGVDVDELPALVPCAAVVTPAERGQLEAAGVTVEDVGRIVLPNGPPEVFVVRLK
jgi:hypothetical protein